MSKTLIILNPHAAGGRAGKVWKKIESILWERLGELVLAVTEHPNEVADHLDEAYSVGLTRVISIGGDGTNHALINALIEFNERHPDSPPMVYGTLPVGTGRDWARTLGIPLDAKKAAHWIADAQPHPVDVGLISYQDGDTAVRRHFLNAASSGISGEIGEWVNRTRSRRAWTFLWATVTKLFTYQPQPMRIELDGELWREGSTYIVTVANGTTFGRGMKIAPNAKIDDGLFDVVLVEGMARARALLALRMVYDGSHLQHPAVFSSQAKTIRISSEAGRLGLELDGEHAIGQDMTFTIRPGLLNLLR